MEQIQLCVPPSNPTRFFEGEYELLCGVRPGDPAADLIAEFPTVKMVECNTETPNGKVGVADRSGPRRALSDPHRQRCRYSRGPGLSRERCPAAGRSARGAGHVPVPARGRHVRLALRRRWAYRPTLHRPRWWPALVGVDEFALGSTMAFRRTDLDRIGGFRGDRRLSGRRLPARPPHSRARFEMRPERAPS